MPRVTGNSLALPTARRRQRHVGHQLVREAYVAGRYFDLQVNKIALQRVGIWLDQVADPVTGRHGYSKKGEPPSRHPGGHIKQFPLGKNEALTGSSLFVRYLLGQNMEKNPIMRKSADRIHSQPPAWTPGAGNIDFYAWYWAAMRCTRSAACAGKIGPQICPRRC